MHLQFVPLSLNIILEFYDVLGEHYSTVAEKLAEKLPKLLRNDIPSTSRNSFPPIKSKHNFIFNTTTEREVYELILKLDIKDRHWIHQYL